jgi:tetratricopeptide (TPR) repeat protein
MLGLRTRDSAPKPRSDVPVDVFDILAVIFGVLFTIRKLDAQKRKHEEFPHVEASVFAEWQSREVNVFTVGMFACFAKIVAELLLHTVLADGMTDSLYRKMTAAIDIPWILVLIVTLVRRHRLAKRRAELRILLGGFVIESKGSQLATELKDAIRLMNEGQLEKAAYQFKQVALDEDDSLRALATYYLGECYLRQGLESEARDAFQESTELDPSLTLPIEALLRLGPAQHPEN